MRRPPASPCRHRCCRLARRRAPPSPRPPTRRPRLAAPPRRRRPSRDPVVAKVGGEEIHLSDVSEAAQTCREKYRQMPPQMLYPMLLDQLIEPRRSWCAGAASKGWTGSAGAAGDATAPGPGAAERAAQPRRSARSSPRRRSRRATTSDVAGKTGEEEVHARAHPGRQRGGRDQDHRRAEEGRRLRGTGQGAQHRPRRRAGRRSRLVQEGRHAAGVLRRPPSR